LNFHNFISKRLFSEQNKSKNISRPIVKIAIGGIALGIAVMILSLSIVTGFQNEIKNKVIGVGSHVSIIKLDNNVSLEPQPISNNQPFLLALKNNSNIKHTHKKRNSKN
jgi:lipoprotein-releasing system permease protein